MSLGPRDYLHHARKADAHAIRAHYASQQMDTPELHDCYQAIADAHTQLAKVCRKRAAEILGEEQT